MEEQSERSQPVSLYGYLYISFSQALEIHIGTGPAMFKLDSPKGGIILVRSHILKASSLKMLSLNV